MCCRHVVVFTPLVIAGLMAGGCGSPKQELPSQEKIQQQLKRDAAMREAEDRLDKEKSAGKSK
jgi:hypothetical protein